MDGRTQSTPRRAGTALRAVSPVVGGQGGDRVKLSTDTSRLRWRRARGTAGRDGGGRRSALATALALPLTLAVIPVAAALAADPAERLKPDPDNWPVFRGDLSLRGVAAGTLPATPTLEWTFDAGSDIEGTAAIADDRVFVGTFAGDFVAIGLQTGKELWRFNVGDAAVQSSPGVYGDKVFFGDEFGVFHALDVATGKEVWKFETRAEILSSPTFHRDLVIIGSYDQFLYALRRDSGELVWKVETEGYIHATPAIVGDTVTVSGCDGFLWLIGLADGEVRAKIDLGGQSGASPAVVGDLAYVGTYENEVLAIDTAAKKVLWRYEHPSRKFPYYASAAVTDNAVVIGGRDKILRALDRDDGSTLWEWNSGSRIDSSVVVVGERGFVGTKNGEVVAVRLSDGEIVWRYDTGSAIVSSPALAKGRLVIGSLDGVVYSFK
ncbi:MAG: serine/threonine protein kinase [Acidobacteria bacterium]|nr:MAG: serine/threonine protein kinase [Acidobacteriota bacterium]REK01063.1 MAG: serine/threonine protein kinase [Acidobacteriota bacterium]